MIKTILHKNIIPILLLFLCNHMLFSQERTPIEEEVDEIIDNIIAIDDDELLDMIQDLNKYQILFVSVDINSKTYFLGRDLGLDQYDISSQLMYENSNGIFAGISGNFYSKFDPKWDLTVLTGGYGKSFGKKDNLRAELSYSRYIFSDATSNDFENSFDGSFHISTPDNKLGSTLSAAYLFGDRKGFQSNLSVYGDIKLFDLNPNNGTKVTLGPDLSLLFASENIDTSRFDDLITNFPFLNRIVDSFETFSLRNIQLQIPVVFELDNLHIEAGYNINFPTAFEFEDSVDNTSFFNLGLTYMFDLK